jgi:hypothetical protein
MDELKAYSLKPIDSFTFWTYHKEPFLDSWVENEPLSFVYSLLICIIAFASLLFKVEDYEKLIIRLNLCSVLSIALSMGVNIDICQPYELLRLLPFYSSIRTPFRFIKVYIVTSSMLAGVVLERLLKLNFKMRRVKKMRWVLAVALSALFALGFTQSFLFSNQFSSRLSNVLSHTSLANIVQMLNNDPDDFIVLGVPPVTHLPHDLYDKLDIAAPNYVLSAFHGKRAFEGPGIAYAYPKIIILNKYLASSLFFMKFGHKVGEVLGLFNIKYILIYKKLIDNDDQAWYPIDTDLVKYLLLQPSLRKIYEDDNFILLKNERWQPRLRIVSDTLLIHGGLGALQALHLLNLYDLKNINIVFYDYDQRGLTAQLLINNFTNKALAYNIQFEDLIFALLPEECKLKLNSHISKTINLFRHILLSPIYDDIVYNDAVMIIEYNETAKVIFNINEKGNYVLLARMYICPESDKLSLIITDDNGHTVISINDVYENVSCFKNSWSFKWIKIPLANLEKGTYNLLLRSSSGIRNYVNVIAIVPEKLFNKLYCDAFKILMNKNVVFIYEAEDNIKPVGPCTYVVEFSSQWRHNAVSNSLWLSNMSSGGGILLRNEGMMEFVIPYETDYNIIVRYLPTIPSTSLLIEVNGQGVRNISTYEALRWHTTIVRVHLRPGTQLLTLKVEGEAIVDVIAIESRNRQSDFIDHATTAKFIEKNTGHFVVNVNMTCCNETVCIILLDTYDQGWVAYYQSEKVRSIESLYCFNSFLIQVNDKSKNITIDLKYECTPLRATGQIISLLTFIACFAIVIARKCIKESAKKFAY